ncbi:hypothetical protein JCM9534A_60430 [Catenuloplanes indicus JCM 9534]|uniref:Secreted Zn-dependent protease n=1 Tax=Catenuloplanes indicus TaxID=137267 RepID=A0AAE4B4I6_9ACTN|nr:putative secreted Zn-dependent protease [Catenuloplanes indicus]
MVVDRLAWVRSSACRDGYCVEVAASPSGILVRDAKDEGRGAVLGFRAGAWNAFIAGVRSGTVRA